jgi:hypothetical protein
LPTKAATQAPISSGEIIHLSGKDLNLMTVEELGELADHIGLDVSGVKDRSILIQRILAQDEETYGES